MEQLAHEHERAADLAELRAVVDVATEHLQAAFIAIQAGAQDSDRTTPEVDRRVKALVSDDSRLSLRLGEQHPIVRSFRQCRDALTDIGGVLLHLRERTPDGWTSATWSVATSQRMASSYRRPKRSSGQR
jgi:hypothetical protein